MIQELLHRYRVLFSILAAVIVLGIAFAIYGNFYRGFPWWQTYQGSRVEQSKLFTIPGDRSADPNDQRTWMSVSFKLVDRLAGGKWQICFIHGSTIKCHGRLIEADATVELGLGPDDLVVFGLDEAGNQLLLQASTDPPNYTF